MATAHPTVGSVGVHHITYGLRFKQENHAFASAMHWNTKICTILFIRLLNDDLFFMGCWIILSSEAKFLIPWWTGYVHADGWVPRRANDGDQGVWKRPGLSSTRHPLCSRLHHLEQDAGVFERAEQLGHYEPANAQHREAIVWHRRCPRPPRVHTRCKC